MEITHQVLSKTQIFCHVKYLELKHKELTKSYLYTNGEKVFVEAFSLVLEGRLGTSKEDISTKYFLRVYIRNLYAEKIDSLEECPIQNTFNRVGGNCMIRNLLPTYERKRKKLVAKANREYQKAKDEFAGFDEISGIYPK